MKKFWVMSARAAAVIAAKAAAAASILTIIALLPARLAGRPVDPHSTDCVEPIVTSVAAQARKGLRMRATRGRNGVGGVADPPYNGSEAPPKSRACSATANRSVMPAI